MDDDRYDIIDSYLKELEKIDNKFRNTNFMHAEQNVTFKNYKLEREQFETLEQQKAEREKARKRRIEQRERLLEIQKMKKEEFAQNINGNNSDMEHVKHVLSKLGLRKKKRIV